MEELLLHAADPPVFQPYLQRAQVHIAGVCIPQCNRTKADGAREAALPPGWQLFQAGRQCDQQQSTVTKLTLENITTSDNKLNHPIQLTSCWAT
ncbi:MAG: hypothetical protein EOO65_00750 [Methanosarcinales archaeon]|nr:MAG: hypothetical protein EOO65_00750 [Methanosarcinales archaeon]